MKWIRVAVTGLFACGDAQAGLDYAGEPLMTLRGVVQSTASLDTGNYVPGLRFSSRYDLADFKCLEDGSCTKTIYYVKGDVEGEFPSAFTLRLFEPPDPDSIEEVVKGESPYTLGDIVAVSPQHPKFLRSTDTSVELEKDNWVSVKEICSDTDQCIEGSITRDCPEGDFTFGDPFPCGGRLPDEYPWNLYATSESHSVIYFVSDVPAGSVLSEVYNGGEALSAGYHVVRMLNSTNLPPDERAAFDDCSATADIEATEEVNRIFGTSYFADRWRNSGGFQDIPEQHRAWEEATFRGLIAHDCRMLFNVVDGSEDPIELTFTDAPPFTAFW